MMREKGVNADTTQLQNKWESTIASYKKVRDWNHDSENEPYSALDRNQCKTEKLPKDFPAEWIEILDSFYGHRPSIIPPCVAESLEDPTITVNPHEQPLPESETELDRNREPAGSASAVRHNSGVKRKNAAGKSATLLSNSVASFTTSMLELERRRDEREEKCLAVIQDLELKKEERIEKSRQLDHENRQALTNAIASLATAIGKAVDIGNINIFSMICVAAFLLIQLALDVSTEMNIEEEQFFTAERLTSSWEKVAVLSTFLASIGIYAETEGQWWVRERSLVWWNYFLSTAYEDHRWVRIMRLPRHLFDAIVWDLNSTISKKDTRFRKTIPSEVRVAACLHRLATGASYFLVGDRFGIGKTTAKECIPEVISAICSVLGRRT
ncbi:hypothetical protein R1sor_001943 [Riccia sorocarpa]|uniref:Uncharacterized protein n=1 Tax=Riccia sorocarpa TaxID=122646 RepID=A0ABD3H1K0_9MARC